MHRLYFCASSRAEREETQPMKAIRIHAYGGPENMVIDSVPVPQPGADDVVVNMKVAGVNFIDIYQRSGLYEGELPFIPGMEGSGQVVAVGAGVTDWKEGDRVAFAMVRGAYAEYACIPADKLVPVPDDVTYEQAAAAMLQGMTAHYLTHSTYALQQESHCLVHAAAGGTGQLIIQMAKLRGATVYGTVSTEEKANIAKEAGADRVILYTKTNFVEAIQQATGGRGVDVVYDSVGQATFEGSLNSLRSRGMLVLFGQSSGPVEPFDPQILNAKGSLYITRPSLAHYTEERDELLARAQQIFSWLQQGQLRLHIDRTFALEEAGRAHEMLANRKTAGKVLLKIQ